MKHTQTPEVLDGSLTETRDHVPLQKLEQTEHEIVVPTEAAKTNDKIHALLPQAELGKKVEDEKWNDPALEAKWMKERKAEHAERQKSEEAARNDPEKKALSAQAKKNVEHNQLEREKASQKDALNVLPPKDKEKKAPWYRRFWNWLTRQK